MSSNRNNAIKLLARLMSGNVCPHKIQLQRVTALLGVVASRTPGGLTVTRKKLKQIGGKFIKIKQNYVSGKIRITAGKPPAKTPQPTHPAPASRQ